MGNRSRNHINDPQRDDQRLMPRGDSNITSLHGTPASISRNPMSERQRRQETIMKQWGSSIRYSPKVLMLLALFAASVEILKNETTFRVFRQPASSITTETETMTTRGRISHEYFIPPEDEVDKTLSTFVASQIANDDVWSYDCHHHVTRKKNPVKRTCNNNSLSQQQQQYAHININPLANCSITTQVRIVVVTRGTEGEQWTLQAIDSEGNNKTVGGDELYITYTDYATTTTSSSEDSNSPPTAVALVDDHNDGTYTLRFVTVPFSYDQNNKNNNTLVGRGTLTVHFQFSCGMAQLYQPLKDGWKTGGATKVFHAMENITMPVRLIERFEDRMSAARQEKRPVNLSSFKRVIFFGDSLMFQMVHPAHTKDEIFFNRNVVSRGNPDLTLTETSVVDLMNQLEEWSGPDLRERKNVALVLGSSAWDLLLPVDVQGPSFDKHLRACPQYLQAVKDKYPNVTVFWRLPSAMHVHTAKDDCFGGSQECIDMLRYMGSNRVEFLYREQLRIMEEHNISVLDMYEASYLSAHMHRPGDALHYQADFNKKVLGSFLFPKKKTKVVPQ